MKWSRELTVLGAILLGGLALRGLYLAEIVHHPDFSYLNLDAGYHDYWARGLVTGDWTPRPDEADPEIRSTPFFRPPGYPYFLSAIYRLAGLDYLRARAAQMALGLVNVLLGYALARRWFGARAGLIAAALMSFHWALVYFEGEFLEPVLLITLGLMLVYVLSLWTEEMRPSRSLLSGVLLGLFALVRPNILVFAPVAALWAWGIARRHGRGRRGVWVSLALFAVGAAAAVCPATVRNWRVAHDFVVISANGGINLHFGNNECADGYSPASLDVNGWSCPAYPGIVRKLGERTGRPMSYSEASSFFAGKALRYARAHPLREARLTLKKALLFWGPLSVSNEKEDECERAHSPVLRTLPFGFPFVLGLFALGLVLCGREVRPAGSREDPMGPRRAEVLTLIVLFIAAYFASYLPFIVAGRYRVPLIPLLIVVGSGGVSRLADCVRERQFARAGGATALALVVIALGSVNVTGYAPDFAKWIYERGVAWEKSGHPAQALAEYREAVRAAPNYADARYNMGLILLNQGQFQTAAEQFEQALRISPGDAEAHFRLGIALRALGRPVEARAHYTRALSLASAAGKPELAEQVRRQMRMEQDTQPSENR